MASFYTALKNKGREGHRHIIYSPDDVSGQTSTNEGHSHQVVTEETIMPAAGPVDPMTGAPTVQMTRVRKMRVMPGADGHEHEIGPVEASEEETKKPEEDTDIVDTVYEMRKKAQSFDLDSRREAEDDEKFLTEDQWEAGDKAEMKRTRRPAITANIAQAKLKSLEGYQRNNRTDFKFRPVENGDVRACDIWDELTKVVCERINYWSEETDQFRSTAAIGLGVLYGYIDYEEDINGWPKVIYIDWKKVNFGPHYRKDAADMEFFTIEDVFSYEKAVSMFPDKEEELKALFEKGQGNKSSDALTALDGIEPPTYDMSMIDTLNKTIRIVELHRYEYEPAYVFVDKARPDNVLNITGMSKADREALKTIENVAVVTRSKKKIRLTRVAGTVLLSDEYPEMITKNFSIWPLYAEKDRDKFRGKIRYIKELCKLTNKYLSVSADILNKMNNYIWFISEGMFKDTTEMTKFINDNNKPGFVSILQDGSEGPRREQGVEYPAALERAIQLNMNIMDNIMNINPELLGMRTNADSGKAEIERKKAALLGNEYLFDNMSMVKKLIGRWFLHVFKKVFGPRRIMRILNNTNETKPFKIKGKPFEKYSEPEILSLLENEDPTDYDVIVSETSMNASMRMANFELLSELAAKGVPIPPPLLLEFAPMTDEQKQMALDFIQQQMEQQAAAEKAKQQSEDNKTMIAAQGRLEAEKLKAAAKIQSDHIRSRKA